MSRDFPPRQDQALALLLFWLPAPRVVHEVVMVLRPRFVQAAIAAVAMGVLASALACGTDPVGVDSCRKIEDARCENAPSCGIDLSHPVHRGDTPSLDVTACKRFYEDACLHGLATTIDPGAVDVQACVDAINNTSDCDIIKNPEKAPACGKFLIPPVVAVVDASVAVDATTD